MRSAIILLFGLLYLVLVIVIDMLQKKDSCSHVWTITKVQNTRFLHSHEERCKHCGSVRQIDHVVH